MKFNILDLLLPRETKFYTLLNKQAENLLDAAREFRVLIKELSAGDAELIMRQQAKVKEAEKAGDKIERQIIDELDKTFITPLDREDIHAIAMNMDKALDLMHNLTRKLEIYGIRSVPPHVLTFCDIIVGISLELVAVINALPTRKGISEQIRIMHELEKRGDDTFAQSLGSLFKDETSAVEIIKFKEVYELLEEIIDSVDYVGKIIRGVLVKLG